MSSRPLLAQRRLRLYLVGFLDADVVRLHPALCLSLDPAAAILALLCALAPLSLAQSLSLVSATEHAHNVWAAIAMISLLANTQTRIASQQAARFSWPDWCAAGDEDAVQHESTPGAPRPLEALRAWPRVCDILEPMDLMTPEGRRR